MAEVLLFHHAQGLTPGVVAFADTLRWAGHVVYTPDLFEGRTFGTLEEGMNYVGGVGFGKMVERGVRAAEGLAAELVYAGFSLGVLPAQMLAQTRRGRGVRCSFMPVCRWGSLGNPGRKGCRCRCMGWTQTRYLWARGTSTRRGNW